MYIEPSELGQLPPRPAGFDVPVDPVTLRVVGGRLHAIAKEMANIVLRMSSSPVVREAEDLGAGLFDAAGREICESESSPMHIGSLPWYIRGFMRRLDGEIEDGDVILHNHPYFGAAHSPDVGVAVPVFWQGQLVAFAAATAHLLDVGGAHPGLNCDAYDVYSEARLLNGIRWYRRGELNRDVDRLIFDNVRTETMNRGDVMAMRAACEVGRQRFLRLLERYGSETVFGTAYQWMDYCEQALRREIALVPDGEYRAPTAWLDDDSIQRGVPLRVETLVTVHGDEITIDLTGSNPEVESGFNVPFEGSLLVSCYFAVRSILLDEARLEFPVPNNEGIFRPVHVVAPHGSMFNPRFPRSCFARFCQVQRVVDNIILALSPVLPQQTTAGNSAACHDCLYAGFSSEAGEYWMYMDVVEGSFGARYGLDGLDSVDNLMANCRNAPIEDTELAFPLRCEQYELRPESAAPGRWRGGIGIVRKTRFLVDGTFSSEGDRSYDAPAGVFGGWSGLGTVARKNPDSSAEERLPTKVTAWEFAAGDVVEVREPNAGGYGDPLDRNPAEVLADVLDGFTSIPLAADAYGVAISVPPGGAPALDAERTRALRAARRQAGPGEPGPVSPGCAAGRLPDRERAFGADDAVPAGRPGARSAVTVTWPGSAVDGWVPAPGEANVYAEALQTARATAEWVLGCPAGKPGPPTRPYTVPAAGPLDRDNCFVARCSVGSAASGPLSGLDIGLKDNISLAGVPMALGSAAMAGYIPDTDAAVVTMLLAAGARIVGKLRMDAFSFGSEGFGSGLDPEARCDNPAAPGHLSGGSSSGAAAATAAGLVDVAIGGDQGGSVRVPAAWCGVVGLKPTRGLVPGTGVVGLEPAIDAVGPIGRTAQQAAYVLRALCPPDAAGQRLAPAEEGWGGPSGGQDLAGLRLGLLREGFGLPGAEQGIDAAVHRAVRGLTERGATARWVSVPEHRDGAAVGYLLQLLGAAILFGTRGCSAAGGGASPGLARALDRAVTRRPASLPPRAKLAMLLSRELGADTLELYQRCRTLAGSFRRGYDQRLADVDALVMPTTPVPPPRYVPPPTPRAALRRALLRPGLEYLAANTAPFNVTGHPAVTIPAGRSNGLPVGLMLAGRWHHDLRLLRIGEQLDTPV